MIVRKVRKTDIPGLSELVFKYKCTLIKDFKENEKARISKSFRGARNQKNTNVLVCIDKLNKILGYTIFHLVNYPMIVGTEVYVSDLLIDENKRGQWVGTILLNEIEKFAKKENSIRIMLNNPKESEGYQREFYKKHGFEERLLFANFVKYGSIQVK